MNRYVFHVSHVFSHIDRIKCINIVLHISSNGSLECSKYFIHLQIFEISFKNPRNRLLTRRFVLCIKRLSNRQDEYIFNIVKTEIEFPVCILCN